MRRAAFFVVSLAACAASRGPGHENEIVPLPTVSAPAATPVETEAQAHELDDVRDPRDKHARSHELLAAEASALETLQDQTAMTSPDRPQLLRRLAETYVELRKAGDAQGSQHAIETYTRLITDYPAHPDADDARYYLGLEYETTGDLANARKTYYDLIKHGPSSRWIPYAYFAFGEIFFEEAKADPTGWDFARQAYEETLKFSASPMRAEAACRLVAVHQNQGDSAGAAEALARFKRNFSGTPAAARCGGT